MRWIVWLLLGFGFAALSHANPTDSDCDLAGFVVDGVTGKGLEDATLELRALSDHRAVPTLDFYPGAPFPLGGSPYSAPSGARGAFCFPAVPQGQYVLSARKDGFADSSLGAARSSQLPEIIDIGHQHRSPVTLSLWPLAAIAGQVSNDDTTNSPTAGLVELLTTVWFRGRPHTVAVNAGEVGADGGYEISRVRPGSYWIRFRPSHSPTLCGDTSLPEQATSDLLPTYYPSAVSLRDAIRVDVSAGERVSGLQIPARHGEAFTVSGKLRMSSGPPDFASLWLLPEDEEPTAWVIGSGMTGPGGEFRFLNVAPGAYTLFYLVGKRQDISVGRVTLVVKDRDITALTIDAPPHGRLRGTLVVEGSGGANIKGAKVALTPVDRIMDPSCHGEVLENGHVIIEGCSAGRHIAAVTPTTSTQYVKEIVSGVADLTNDLTSGPYNDTEFRVVLREDGARIRGTFSTSGSSWYVIVPREVPAEVLPARIRVGYSDSYGRFLVEGLPPGRYAVVGITAPDVSDLHNPSALVALGSLGTDVKLRGSEEAVVTTRVIDGH